MTCIKVTISDWFSAAHRLHSPHLSEEENKRIFGKCNWINGHGHNYKIEITIEGKIDQKTGMVVNLSDLKELVKSAVLGQVDHRNLDKDILFFAQCPSTTENLLVFVVDELVREKEDRFGRDCGWKFVQVVIYETERNKFSYSF